MLKEVEVFDKGIRTLKDCLSVVPSLQIISEGDVVSNVGPDYRIGIQGKGFEQIIYLEVKALGTPKSTREAVNLLLRWLQKEPDAYGVVIAPYISPESVEICKEAGVGYVDLSGNCSIVFHQVFISRERMGNRFPFKTKLNTVFSPKSERILRVLLTYPYQNWKAIDLAKEAQVSLGMITQVSKKLIEQEWMEKTPRGISLHKPENLLAEWTKNYTIKRNTLNNYYSLKSLRSAEIDVAEQCEAFNISYALTGFSAGNRLAPMVKGQRAMIYVNADIGLIAEKAGLKPVESGANIILIQPYDEGVYWNTRPIDNIQIADPVQVYLDLKRYPGRGEEAADFLYKEVINPRWQQLKMNMIAS